MAIANFVFFDFLIKDFIFAFLLFGMAEWNKNSFVAVYTKVKNAIQIYVTQRTTYEWIRVSLFWKSKALQKKLLLSKFFKAIYVIQGATFLWIHLCKL